MKKIKILSAVTLIAAIFGLISSKVQAQEISGALNFGFDAGANKYWGNFSDSHFGLGGDLFIRYNIIDWVSLRASYNAGVIGYKTTQASINDEHALFGIPSPTNGLGSDGGPI